MGNERWLACPVEGCPHSRASAHMMCRACWARVTKPTQGAVYKAWRAYRRAATGGVDEKDRRAAHDAYYAVREQAIREAEA